MNFQTLEKAPLFRALESQQRTELAGFLKYMHFDAGTLICELGRPGETMYFIERGDVAFYTRDAAGQEKIFRTLGAGDFFGEVAVLTNRGRRSANARAKTEVFAWELHRNDFPAFVKACPDLTTLMMKEMAHRLETSGAMLHDTVESSIAMRIDASRTNTEKCVEGLVKNIGGIPALAINGIGCLLWICVNKLLPTPWDTPEFGFLALFLALEALLVTILVLAKQNRDEKDANIRNETIMEKVQTTPQEIKYLREQVTELTELIHAGHQNGQ